MKRVPVIIDTDPGVDDVVAILLALASPEIEILAYAVCFGNTDLDACHLNIFRVYRTLERHLLLHPEDAPRFPGFNPTQKPYLVQGSTHPLHGNVHGAQYFHGRDGLGGISDRHPDIDEGCDLIAEAARFFKTFDGPPEQLTIDLLQQFPEREITYLVLGPMTNLYHTVQADRQVFRDRIGSVVCMGGAIDVAGNTSASSEFNWFADPWAVKELLMNPGEGLSLDRFLLLPLDITTPHELPFPVYQSRVDNAFESTVRPSKAIAKSPLVHFTSAFLERTREVMLQFGNDAMELHDPSAVWCALSNPPALLNGKTTIASDGTLYLSDGWVAVKRFFDIERTGELTRGMCVVDRRSDQTAYAPGANRSFVQSQLDSRRLAHPNVWESTAKPAPVEVATASAANENLARISTDETELRPASKAVDGIWCIIRTPGPDALLDTLLERIWGVSCPAT